MTLVLHRVDSFVLKEAAEFVYKEISEGIYFAEKNRDGNQNIYVEAREIVALLNSSRRVYVSSHKALYSNFEV